MSLMSEKFIITLYEDNESSSIFRNTEIFNEIGEIHIP